MFLAVNLNCIIFSHSLINSSKDKVRNSISYKDDNSTNNGGDQSFFCFIYLVCIAARSHPLEARPENKDNQHNADKTKGIFDQTDGHNINGVTGSIAS